MAAEVKAAPRLTRRVGSVAFALAVKNAPKQEYLSHYSVDAYSRMRCYLTDDERGGYAINGDEIVNVFNAGVAGRGQALVRDAVANGGRRLDCFDGWLVGFYSGVGFKVEDRLKWDDRFAPGDWDYEQAGRPDVVLMRFA